MTGLFVHESWVAGRRQFCADIGDGEARAVLTPIHTYRIDAAAYGVESYPPRKVFYVDFIKVSPAHRGIGYGRAIRDAIVRWSDLSKNIIILDAIPIDSGMDQHRLVRFYTDAGFKMVGGYSKTSMYYHSRMNKQRTKQTPKLTTPQKIGYK